MQKLRQTFRLLMLGVATGGVLAVATNAALFVHWHANTTHPLHTHAGDDHDHDEEPLNSHHSETCHICQVVLGPGSKYLSIPPITASFTVEPTPFVCRCRSHCMGQHTITPFSARGPPAC